MAGRGRGMTLPSWMTDQAQQPPLQPAGSNGFAQPDYGYGYGYGASAQAPTNPPSGYAANAVAARDRESERRSDRGSRSRDRRASSKSSRKSHRSRSRSRNSSRSRSRRSSKRRDDSRSRSRSRSRRRSPSSSGYKSRRRNKKSNFDVKPSETGLPIPLMMPSRGPAQPAPYGGFPHGGAQYGAPQYGGPPPSLGGPPQMSSSMQQTRHARRMYVGGIGHDANEMEITNFFNDVISKALHKPGENPVMTVYINHERCFAFVELNTIELATACMQLDGIKFKGQTLRVRRPNDYNPSTVPPPGPIPTLDLSFLGVVSTTVPDGPNKVFVGGLPYSLSDEQVKELLSSFGQLKAFHLVREPGSLLSKGYGFCEYMDPSVTRAACEGLNGLPVGDKTLTVRVAEPKGPPVAASGGQFDMTAALTAGVPGQYGAITFDMKPPTRVLVLSDMVSKQELEDDQEYADILDDVRFETEQHGKVLSVVIPREKDGYTGAAIGRIFVEYSDPQQARNAGIALSSKKFGEKIVQADYYPEETFAAKRFGE